MPMTFERGTPEQVALWREDVAEARANLVIEDMTDNTVVDGQTITGRELKDLNRARAYLRDLANRHANAKVFSNVEEATNAIMAE